MWYGVLTGIVPSTWPELSSWSLGKMLTSFSLVSDLRTQNAQAPSVIKFDHKQVKANRPVGLRVLAVGEASGATCPILTVGPLLLSWAIVTQRLEATPEPGRPLHEGLVQCQCHLSREVGMLGCPGPPLPRPLAYLPSWWPDPPVTLPESVFRMCCCLCSEH